MQGLADQSKSEIGKEASTKKPGANQQEGQQQKKNCFSPFSFRMWFCARGGGRGQAPQKIRMKSRWGEEESKYTGVLSEGGEEAKFSAFGRRHRGL